MQTVDQTHGTYVVTYDVASRIQSFRSKGFHVPNQNDSMFDRFHLRLLETMQDALPGVMIDSIDMSKLRLEIWEQVEGRMVDLNRQAVLSTCPEIADSNPKSEGLLLNVNRLFDKNGQLIGYGPRPGFELLTNQLDKLARKIAGRSVILIEDGAFTGGTLSFVLKELESRGIKVTAIIIGFCCNGSRTVLRKAFSEELVMVHPVTDLVDWIPDHDLIPFIPNCGRVLGEHSMQGYMPIRTVSGFSCAYPYILPFGRIEEWASLPDEGARAVSRLCLDTSIEIFSHVGCKITIGKLLELNPRVSLPIRIGSHEVLPALDMEIVSFLKQMREKLE